MRPVIAFIIVPDDSVRYRRDTFHRKENPIYRVGCIGRSGLHRQYMSNGMFLRALPKIRQIRFPQNRDMKKKYLVALSCYSITLSVNILSPNKSRIRLKCLSNENKKRALLIAFWAIIKSGIPSYILFFSASKSMSKSIFP